MARPVHRWHHELPYYHVSLDGIGLAAVWFSVVAVLLVGFGLLTYGLALPSGLFVPCIMSGAALGRLVGEALGMTSLQTSPGN